MVVNASSTVEKGGTAPHFIWTHSVRARIRECWRFVSFGFRRTDTLYYGAIFVFGGYLAVRLRGVYGSILDRKEH